MNIDRSRGPKLRPAYGRVFQTYRSIDSRGSWKLSMCFTVLSVQRASLVLGAPKPQITYPSHRATP